jgi:magnesium chelatase subunit I
MREHNPEALRDLTERLLEAQQRGLWQARATTAKPRATVARRRGRLLNMNEPVQFPLAAVVGADDLKLALCLTAIDPKIGGVLIEGPRGMAKSTLARGLADLLGEGRSSPCRWAPPKSGWSAPSTWTPRWARARRSFSPGVLARPMAACCMSMKSTCCPTPGRPAAGRGRQRHQPHRARRHLPPARRFVLIGTMNPEEGELRPQLLDRFGLNVALDGLPAPEARQQIIRRRLAFDSDPQAFCAQWATPRRSCASAARRRASAWRHCPGRPGAGLDHRALFAAGVDGLRADLVWLRAARAHAAWRGHTAIEEQDVDAVAEFALRHRRRALRRHRPPRPVPPSSRRHRARPRGRAIGALAAAAGGQRRSARGAELGKKP